MPNDAVLDPTVHHLCAKDRLNRGKSSRSWPLYPRCGHDLSPPRCPPFLEAGTPDLLWLYKSQRKASEKGTSGRSRGQITNRNKKKTRGRVEDEYHRGRKKEKKTKKQGAGDEKGDTQTKKKKTGIIQRRRERQRSNTETSIGSAIAFVLTEKERPIIIQNKFTAGWPLHHLLSSKSCWESKRKRRQVNGEGRQREAVGSVATIFAVSRSRYARSSSPFYILWNLSGARTLCEGNFITFALFMHAWRCFTRASGFCPAGSLAWASDRAGLAGSSPTHMGWAGLTPKKKYMHA